MIPQTYERVLWFRAAMLWAVALFVLPSLDCSPTTDTGNTRLAYPILARIVKIEKTEASRTQDRLPCRSTAAGGPCFEGFEVKYQLTNVDSFANLPVSVLDTLRDSLLLYDLQGYAYPDTHYINDNSLAVGTELAGTLYVAVEPDTSWQISFPELTESEHVWSPCIPGGRCVQDYPFVAQIVSVQKMDTSDHDLSNAEHICYDSYEVRYFMANAAGVVDSIQWRPTATGTNRMFLRIQTPFPNRIDGLTTAYPGPLFIEKYRLFVGRILTGTISMDFWYHDGEVSFDSVDLQDGFEYDLCAQE